MHERRGDDDPHLHAVAARIEQDGSVAISYHRAVGSGEVTRLIRAVARGEPGSEELLVQVYEELRRIARARMARERPGHTLQPTALVHEAYLRLVGDAEIAWDSRAHFYAAAAEAMRRILIDHARRRATRKHGGDRVREPLEGADLVFAQKPEEILAVDEALSRMQEDDPRGAEIVRFRFFAGLSIEETAQAMDLSPRTVRREWLYARAKLFKALNDE